MSATYDFDCECDNFEMLEDQDVFTMNEGIPGPGVPAGGSAGQILQKHSSADYDTEWTTPTGYVPAGGTVGQYLRKESSTDYDADWYTLTAGDVAFNKESGYVSGTVGRYLQLLDSEDVQYTYGGEKELGTVGETLDYLADKSVEIGEDVDDLKNTLNHKADVIYDTVSGDIASFPDGADGLPVKDLTVGIEPVQSGTGDPSPDNVRPISGWTGANVTKTGKNLAKAYEYTASNSGITFAYDGTDACELNGTAAGDVGRPLVSEAISNGYTFLLKAGTYITSADDNDVVVQVYDKNINLLSSSTSFTLSKDTEVFVRLYVLQGKSFTNKTVHYQLEPGSTASTYEAYQGVTIPISWQSSAGTVYGGTVDPVTGKLMVLYGMLDLGGFDWTYDTAYTNKRFFVQSSASYNIKRAKSYSSVANIICSLYKADTATNVTEIPGNYNRIALDTNNPPYIIISDNIHTSAADFKQFVTGQKLVYELATPLEYTLTPQQLITLLGENNIWADCGPSIVEYPCDTKLYIERLTAPEEDDMIADANIASGKYFIVNNNLYLSTTTILAGDPIKPGTNCTLTNLAAALNAINS